MIGVSLVSQCQGFRFIRWLNDWEAWRNPAALALIPLFPRGKKALATAAQNKTLRIDFGPAGSLAAGIAPQLLPSSPTNERSL